MTVINFDKLFWPKCSEFNINQKNTELFCLKLKYKSLSSFICMWVRCGYLCMWLELDGFFYMIYEYEKKIVR